jgi:hypothetical protein
MTVPVKQPVGGGDIIEEVIAKNDLSKLTIEQRNNYYMAVCKSIGLNPLTQPLAYIPLNGKLTLYAKRDCADQLRKLHGISIEIISQEQTDGLLTVHVRAKDQTGRQDEDLGVVSFPETLRGENRANAILKAVTKAKRRVTLSISGLGFLDETEVEDIPAAAKRPLPPAPNVLLHDPSHDPSGSQESAAEPAASGEVAAATSPQEAAGTSVAQFKFLDHELGRAAEMGTAGLETVWNTYGLEQRKMMKPALEKRHKPRALEVDARRRQEDGSFD